MGAAKRVKAAGVAVDRTNGPEAADRATGPDVADGATSPGTRPRTNGAGAGDGHPTAPGLSHRRPSRAAIERGLVRADVPAWRRAIRYHYLQLALGLYGRLVFRLRLEGRENILPGPALYCFNHLSWIDPLVMLAVWPWSPRLSFYGPREEDLRTGFKNRLMWWSGIAVPFSPSKDDLITSVRRAQAVFEAGGGLAISGEGGIHVHEGDLLPFQEGAAYLALRARVPIVPVAITGTSWTRFRGDVRIRVGEPIETGPRPTREVVAAYTARTWHALKTMVADDRDQPPPGRLGRWFTDLFNDWGAGGREAASLVRGPAPEDVPLPPLPELPPRGRPGS